MAEIRKSLYKPQLFCGIERIYAISLAIAFIIIIFYGAFIHKIVGSIIISSIWILMASANSYDYIFFSVLLKYLTQKDYYLAHSGDVKIKRKRRLFKV